jgi:hypothetical protein
MIDIDGGKQKITTVFSVNVVTVANELQLQLSAQFVDVC